jgi:UDP-GlcNAc:undecaprenyl-phosphate GlcNAc-1-phosphate transferase
LDGLAGGVGVTALAALAILGYGTLMFVPTVLLASTLAAFLVFNVPMAFNRPFRSFMGDAGSTSLGLAIGCIGIALSQGPDSQISPVIGLWLVAVPVFDFFTTVIRRIIDGRSPLVPDHAHLHHTLVLNGLSRRVTLLVMLAFSLLCAGTGVVGHAIGLEDGTLLLFWLFAGFLYYRATGRPKIIVGLVQRIQPSRTIPPIDGVGEP